MTSKAMKKELDELKKIIGKSKKTDAFSKGFQQRMDLQVKQKIRYEKELKKQERQQKREEQKIRIKENKLKLIDKYKSQKGKATILKEELNKRDNIIKNLEDRLKKLEKKDKR